MKEELMSMVNIFAVALCVKEQLQLKSLDVFTNSLTLGTFPAPMKMKFILSDKIRICYCGLMENQLMKRVEVGWNTEEQNPS